MIALEKTLISEDILDKQFMCDLDRCHGACCVEGDAGAPLEKEEITILENIYPQVAPFLRPQGKEAIEKLGTSVIDPTDEEPVTPLVYGAECAYAVFDDKGTALCGIEKAYNAGEIDFQKPISCHLYPIRIEDYEHYDALNYDRWPICDPACSLGESLQIPVYRFAKDALVRRYGTDWYGQLKELAALHEQKAKDDHSPHS